MYREIRKIGSGANGDVILGQNIEKGSEHVIKILKMRDINEKQRETIQTQLKLLKQFKHPNIVPFHDSFIDKQGSLNIVMAHCEGGDMHHLIENAEGKKFSEKQIIDWIVQLALSIFYMHERRVLHRDIKTQNIFLTSGRVMLGDFGVSKVLDKAGDLARTNIGTPYYMSPQQYRYKPYSYKSDIWAFGCIIYEMCNHKHVFEALSLQALAVKVTRGVYAPVSQFYSNNLRSLVDQMLNQNPKMRPSIIQILKRPFLFRRVQHYMKQVFQNRANYEPQQIQSLKAQAKSLNFTLEEDTKKKVSSKAQRTPSKSSKGDRKTERSQQKMKQQKEKKYQELRKKLQQKLEEKSKAQEKIKEMKKMNRNNSRGSQKNLRSHLSNYGSVKSHRQSVKTQQSTVSSKIPNIEKQYSKSKPKLEEIDYRQKQEKISVKEKEVKKQVPKVSVAPVKQSKNYQSKEEQKMQKFKMKEDYDMDYEDYDEQNNKDQLNQIYQDDEFEEETGPNTQNEQEKIEQMQKEVEAAVNNTKNLQNIVSTPAESQPIEQQINTVNNKNNNSNKQSAEESIHQLRQEVKQKTILISNIRQQMTKLDFVISSDSDNQNSNQRYNPTYAKLTEKINDLKHKVISQLGRSRYADFLEFVRQPNQVNREQVVKMIGEDNIGVYHIAQNIVKLDKVLAKVPKYVL